MIRKILTIFSLFGLLLSVGLWGVSYFNITAHSRGHLIEARTGHLHWLSHHWPRHTRFS